MQNITYKSCYYLYKHRKTQHRRFSYLRRSGALLFDSFAFVVTALLDDLAIRQPTRVGNSSKNRGPLA